MSFSHSKDGESVAQEAAPAHEGPVGFIAGLLADKEPVRLSFYNLFWIFVVTCVVGLLCETLVAWVMDGRLESRSGLVWGPFSPIYGTGAVLFTVALNQLRDKSTALIFVAAAVLGACFEYFAGWVMEEGFGLVAWSYADEPLNFHGHTSVRMAVVWGIAGVAWMRLGLPLVMRLISIPKPSRDRSALTAIAAVIMGIDIVMTLLSAGFWLDRARGEVPQTPVERFFAQDFSDEFMATRFETISQWPELASR